jgi:hypothetical protein
MMQLRFGQCGVPVMSRILGPIGVDGPLAGLWRQAAAVKTAANGAQFGAFAPIDCSPFIDSLFAGSPIKNCLPGPISRSTAIPASNRYRLRNEEIIHDQHIKACPYCRAGGDERRITGIRPIVQ